mmetsp:Transcript_69785/g.157705  ORF Transcript_69785/g.157705 Transcript_69785/m.157705 type:complete len:354 (-) Transcript_69785:201-1262(-)
MFLGRGVAVHFELRVLVRECGDVSRQRVQQRALHEELRPAGLRLLRSTSQAAAAAAAEDAEDAAAPGAFRLVVVGACVELAEPGAVEGGPAHGVVNHGAAGLAPPGAAPRDSGEAHALVAAPPVLEGRPPLAAQLPPEEHEDGHGGDGGEEGKVEERGAGVQEQVPSDGPVPRHAEALDDARRVRRLELQASLPTRGRLWVAEVHHGDELGLLGERRVLRSEGNGYARVLVLLRKRRAPLLRFPAPLAAARRAAAAEQAAAAAPGLVFGEEAVGAHVNVEGDGAVPDAVLEPRKQCRKLHTVSCAARPVRGAALDVGPARGALRGDREARLAQPLLEGLVPRVHAGGVPGPRL